MVMAVVGPEALDYLGSQTTSVLEECREATGVSYSLSTHNYCVLKGELETINRAYKIIDEHMTDILENPVPAASQVASPNAAVMTPVVGTGEQTVIITGESQLETEEEHVLQPESGLLESCSGYCETERTEENRQQGVNKEKTAESMGLGSSEITTEAQDSNECCGSHEASNKVAILDAEVKNNSINQHDQECSKVSISYCKASALGILTDVDGAGVSVEESKLQGGGKLVSESSPVTGHEQMSDVVMLKESETAEKCTKQEKGPSAGDRGVLVTTPVMLKKSGRKPKSQLLPSAPDVVTVSEDGKESEDRSETLDRSSSGSSRNLRRKRSTYRDYQSRMDALVKPWTSKTAWEDGEELDSETDMVIKEESSDEESSRRSRKRALEDATYVPEKVPRVEVEAQSGSTPLVKRGRGRPRKTPLIVREDEIVEPVVVNIPISVKDEKKNYVQNGAVSNDKQGEPVVESISYEGKTIATPVCGEQSSCSPALAPTRDNVEKHGPKITPVTVSGKIGSPALAPTLDIDNVDKPGSKITSVAKHEKAEDAEEKSNVELDVIKDDITGDIKLSLSVSFPTPAPKQQSKKYFRPNRRQLQSEKRYECDICMLIFKWRRELSQHHFDAHNLKRAPRIMAVCDVCGKKMRQKHLKTHINSIHKSEKPFECDICEKRFSTNSYLKYHLSTHKNSEERERPHLCSICGRGFYKIAQLKDHQNSHTGARPYNCKLCDKTFPYRSAVRKHMNVHTQEKPFQCHICHKMFKSKDYLRNHHVTHEPQSFSCSGCKRVYSYRHSLLTHQRRCPAIMHGIPDGSSDWDAPVQRYMCGYCQQVFTDLETVQEHLTQHVQQEVTTAEELMQTLADAEVVQGEEEREAAIHLETEIIQNDSVLEEDGMVPEMPESTVIIQEDIPMIIKAETADDEIILVSESNSVALDGSNIPMSVTAEGSNIPITVTAEGMSVTTEGSNIPMTVIAEVQTADGTLLEVPVIIQASQD